jgi:hypothetical protein
MSYCTLDENIVPGNCPRCDAELAALRRVVSAARVLVFDEGRGSVDKRLGALGLALEEALDALDAASQRQGKER